MRLRLEKTKVKAEKPYLEHLGSSTDLVTTYAEIRAGFLALALEKSRRATPFVAEAIALKAAANRAKSPQDLLAIEEIQPALLSAAGISDKAAKHLQTEDKLEALRGLIKNYLEPAGSAFVEELVFRFLLTRGDALGGSMRNIGGVLAQRKLTRALISTLRLAGISYRWLHAGNNTWAEMMEDDADIELYLRGLAWQNRGRNRTVVYNLTVPLVGNNIDLSLLVLLEISPPLFIAHLASIWLLGNSKAALIPPAPMSTGRRHERPCSACGKRSHKQIPCHTPSSSAQRSRNAWPMKSGPTWNKAPFPMPPT